MPATPLEDGQSVELGGRVAEQRPSLLLIERDILEQRSRSHAEDSCERTADACCLSTRVRLQVSVGAPACAAHETVNPPQGPPRHRRAKETDARADTPKSGHPTVSAGATELAEVEGDHFGPGSFEPRVSERIDHGASDAVHTS